MKKSVKFKWGIAVVLLLICVSIMAFYMHRKQQKDITFDEMIQDYVKDYQVDEESEDGSAVVTVEAPDFVQIILTMSNKESYQDISMKKLNKAIKKNPKLVKKYKISVEKLDEKNIKKALLSQISYELLIQAIEQSGEGEAK